MRGPSSFAIGAGLACSFLPCGFGAACFCCGIPLLSPPLGFASRFCSLPLSLAMLCLDLLAVTLEHAHLAAVFERLDARAVGLLRGGVEERDVRDVDRQVLVDDAALLAFHRIGPLVLLHAVHALDHHVLGVDATQHRAALALVAAGEHHHLVALADFFHLEHLRSKRDDLHELLGAQLARHRPEDARADRLHLRREQHRRVAVEFDQRAVGAAHALAGARHDLVREMGRHSAISTRSPSPNSPVSTCAWYFFDRVMVLPIMESRTRRSTRTTTVFCILLLVTRPTSLRWFLAGAAWTAGSVI